jgi:SAM-dependent methyltransferase
MNWEETLKLIREKPEFKDLVEKSYISTDLIKNVNDYKKSDEYIEIKKIISDLFPNTNSILDIGAGNGISSIAFALDGYVVTALEPDPSITEGAGAISKIKEKLNLSNVTVLQGYAEDVNLPTSSFDLVFCRQSMHHAANLDQFVNQSSRALKSGGGFIAVRDHVINSEKDKKVFLNKHPLHKFYGGENAFTLKEYTGAIEKANLKLVKILKYYDSIINYFPATKEEIQNLPYASEIHIHNKLKSKLGLIGNLKPIIWLYKLYSGNLHPYNDEKIPGRPYTFIAQKP